MSQSDALKICYQKDEYAAFFQNLRSLAEIGHRIVNMFQDRPSGYRVVAWLADRYVLEFMFIDAEVGNRLRGIGSFDALHLPASSGHEPRKVTVGATNVQQFFLAL